jgi:XRE family transcriptional regulator, master regulator for biofilm formation
MIGKLIKRLREEKGFSITKLARLAGVSKSYLSQIERGLQSNPSLQFLMKVAVPLGTNLDYLLGEAGLKRTLDLESDLDDEWKLLIKQAIEHGLKKEDFLEYRNYIKFQNWMKEQKKN